MLRRFREAEEGRLSVRGAALRRFGILEPPATNEA